MTMSKGVPPLRLPQTVFIIGVSAVISFSLCSCSGSGGNVSSADEIANKLAARNITCTSPKHDNLLPPAAAHISCDVVATGTAADIWLYNTHDEAVAAYRQWCNEYGANQPTTNGGVTHMWLGGNWWLETRGTASTDDIRNAIGDVADTDCQQ